MSQPNIDFSDHSENLNRVWRGRLDVKAGERQGVHATKTFIGTGLLRLARLKTTHVSKIDERKVEANKRKHCALTVAFQQISSATKVGSSLLRS
jgi:hypothetical protein